MDVKLRDTWTEALRSGDYTQACGVLHDPVEGGYCCLGVLGKICGADLNSIESLEIPGFPNREFLQEVGLHKDVAHELASANDHGYDFEYIADEIEAYGETIADDS